MWKYDLNEERVRGIGAELKARNSKPKPRRINSLYSQNQMLVPLRYIDVAPNPKYDIDFSDKSNDQIKKLFLNTLNKGMHGMCFSPYMEGQDTSDILSEEQIIRRIKIIKPYTKWVRSFSCTNGNEHIPKVAKANDLKTMVGASIGANMIQNENEIKKLIELGKSGYVDIAVVGNEVLLRKELSEKDILNYISRIKKALPNIPVAYVDSYYIFNENPSLIDICDVILINCYPFWEGSNIENSPSNLRNMYKLIQDKANGKPVIISETGWPSEGENTEDAVPSKYNAMKYFINVNNWVNKEDIKLFYFSSFDESWKIRQEGDVGQRWGIWDKNEKQKFN
jgi:GPH family glycoside/pentoside/hexuronide:cation symporter